MKTLLRLFFHLLYHQFAFTYDWVAGTVSLGRWKDWVLSVVPFVEGRRILEIGHGPGHLHRALAERGLFAVGIDESAQMGRLAKRNLKRSLSSSEISRDRVYAQINLTRGISQQLPFSNESFETLVATFPSGYIFDTQTLLEAQRVLTRNGQLIILPAATILGRGILDRAMALLFRITGETPPDLAELLRERTKEPFPNAGFEVQIFEVDLRSSRAYIVVATKPSS